MSFSTLTRRTPLRQKKPMARGTKTLARTAMKNRSRKPSRTVATKRHMSEVASLGCVVCRNEGFGQTPAELHHPRYSAGGGQKSSDLDVIPLCPIHHRLGGYGVAYHAGREAWEAKFGTEEQLLEQVRREIGNKERA